MKITVSCVQIQPKTGDRAYNLAQMKEQVEHTMSTYPKTNLIVFPELMTTGYEATKEEFQALAEILPWGESMTFMGELAKKHNVHIVYGLPERDPLVTDVLYNAAVLIDNKGAALGTYRKVHPFDGEKMWCRAGNEFPVFDTEIGKLAIMICWDTAFPEVARTYGLKGAELLIVSTNWEKPYDRDWDLITRARAFDNTLHLVAANRIGDDKTLGFFGHSKIVSPTGEDIAALDEEVAGVISAEIDLSLTEKERVRYYTFFKDRRPDTYGEVTRRY